MTTRRPDEPGLSDVLDVNREVLASALALVALFPILRLLTPRLSTEVRSLLVWAGAVAAWLAVAWYFSHRGNFLGGWILAFGLVFAYSANLIVQLAAGPDVAVVLVAALPAAAVSVPIAGLGYLAGRGFRHLISTSIPPE